MTILQYSHSDRPSHWLAQIEQCEWRAAKFLATLLREGRFRETLGPSALYLLTDGDALASFLTLAQRDCIDAPDQSPWIGFVHTAPAYRGRRCAGQLIEHACAVARAHGASKVYVCTDHVGLYEKYGFTYLEDRVSIYGEMSRVYVRDISVPLTYRPVAAADFALGCTHAAEIDPKHAANVLCDMQLEYDLQRGTSSYAIQTGTLDAATFIDLYTAVGWEAPGEGQVAHALANTLETFLVLDGDRPVAMARLLGDLAMSCYVKDFAVRPEYQGRGVGRRLMHAIEAYIRENRKNGWHMSLELISAKGKEGFYCKLGFEERPCDRDGAGMFKMIRESS